LKELIHELKCIQYGRFKLDSGGISDYKIICDSLFVNEEAKSLLSKLGHRMFQDVERGKRYDIVGIVTGGYEFAKLVSERINRKVVAVNPHNGSVNGRLEQENQCYFEDVVTKGGSIIKCKNILGKNGNDFAISIVDRQENAEDNLRKNGIELRSILTRIDLIKDSLRYSR